MEIKDSLSIDNKKKKYFVDYDISYSITFLPDIAWEASKMANVTNDLPYPCLESLIYVYSMQELYKKEERNLLSYSIYKNRLEFFRRLELV